MKRDPYVLSRMPLLWELIIPLNKRGITVDKRKRDQLRKERDSKLQSWRRRATKTFKAEGFELPLGKKGAPSSKKVQEILYDSLNLPTRFDPKTGKPTAARRALQTLRPHDASGIVELLLEYSDLKEAAVPLSAVESPDGRMRTRFVFGGDEKSDQNETGRNSPASGRLASRQLSSRPPLGTNLQNWIEWVRCVLIAKENWRLVKADYSQIELRLIAYFSDDRNLKKALEGDAHLYIAYLVDRETDLYGLHRGGFEDLVKRFEDGEEEVVFARNETKRIVYGWSYRMGAKKMENVKGVPFQRGKRALEGLKRTFPGIVRWWAELEEIVTERSKGSGWGHLENPWGRRRYFFTDDVPAICNFLPQSSAADILFDSMLEIERALRRKKPKLLLTVHDEVVLESPEAAATAKLVRKLMEKPIDPLDRMIVPVDVMIGRNWAKKSKSNPEGVRAA